MKVKYTGTADVKEYSAADLKRALGLDEAKAVKFKGDEVVEVPDAVGEALVSKDGIFGEEFFVEVKDEESEASNDDAGDDELNLDDSEADLGTADSAAQQTSNSGPAPTPTSKRSRGATTTRR